MLVSLLFSNGFEQFLSILRLTRELFLLPAGCLGFLHAAKFLGGVFQTQVSVSVERDADISVAHQVLQRLRIHPGLGLIAAVGMAADVRGDVRQLNPVDIVVAFDHMVETVLPVHRHFRQAVLVQKQKTAVPVDHALDPGGRPVLNDGAEALLNVGRHRKLTGSSVGLGLLKQAPVISWDGLVESGYELAAGASPEESAVTKSEYRSIKAVMDAEDPRIAKAFEMKKLFGYSVKEIAVALDLSEARIYQLVSQAKAIGREYRQKNG